MVIRHCDTERQFGFQTRDTGRGQEDLRESSWGNGPYVEHIESVALI